MTGTLAALRARLPRDPDLGPPVLLLLGIVGLAGSTRHVLTLARGHGAAGVDAWLVAFVWEIMAAFSGWEIRRRASWWRLIPTATLVAAVLFVLAANLEASGLAVLAPDVWRRIVSTSPALVFLAVLALVETREWRIRRPTPKRRPAPAAGTVGGPVPGLVAPGTGTTPPAGVSARLDGLTPNTRTVWHEIMSAAPGGLTPAGIRERTGLGKDPAYRAVKALVDADLVTTDESGKYTARRIEAVAS